MTADKTLLRMKYVDVVKLLAERTGVSCADALGRFYASREYRLLANGISDLHCMTPDYIVDDILAEQGKTRTERTVANRREQGECGFSCSRCASSTRTES